ncbi:MAG: hypothetical protein K9G33_10870 [Sneathiella sp.]|nr:hypothetical protein [Sneathiella sp.]
MEDEENSTVIFYTRLFALAALIALIGFICRQFLADVYLWVMALEEGPATFFVGIIGFGGLILATVYNGYETRKNLKEEKLHLAKNNAAILDSEILGKVAALSRVIERVVKSDLEDVSKQVQFATKAYPEAFNKFTCESDKEYFAGFKVKIVRQIFLTATAATSLQTIVEFLISEDFKDMNTNKEAFVNQGNLVIERNFDLLHMLNEEFNLDGQTARTMSSQ